MKRAILSGLKTAAVVAISAFLLQAVDVVVKAVSEAPLPVWAAPWGPLLIPLSGVVKGLIKKWELAMISEDSR